MSDLSHLCPLLDSAPARVVFGHASPEWEAAHCNLAALLIHQDRIADVRQHRYAFSLGLVAPAPATAYVHYFAAPPSADGPAEDGPAEDGSAEDVRRPLVPVTTLHTPGVDDLGGLIRLRP